MIAINGVFITQAYTGVQRFSVEIIKSLDTFASKTDFVLVIPLSYKFPTVLKNISIVNYGKKHGVAWEQINFSHYCKKNKLISLNLGNSMPLIGKGIICIHDCAYSIHREFFTTLHGKLSCVWHSLLFKKAMKGCLPIFTVSMFSKSEIISKYHVNPNRIFILGNGWDHVLKIKEDANILEKYSLLPKSYYYTLGSKSINKNTKYIYEIAKRNKNSFFVVSGMKAKVSNEKYNNLPNVLNLGFLSDGEIKSLMINCKAFIFPSIHEGFGIPPLEALSYGKKIIISSSSCLPEIFESSAIYIDPYDYNIDIDNLLLEKAYGSNEILSKFTWKKLGQKMYKTLKAIL